MQIFLFSVSLIISAAVIYLLGRLWFGDKRNRKLGSFFVLGIIVSLWTLFNAICMVMTGGEAFVFVYTLRMVMLCLLPYSLLWFFLHFTRSRFSHSKVIFRLLCIVSAVDVLAVATNPLHHLYFTDYGYPHSAPGLLFWIHILLAYITILLVIIVLFGHIARGGRRNGPVLITALVTLIPLVVNILLTFRLWPLSVDITPILFALAFILFCYTSYTNHLLHLVTVDPASVFSALKEAVIILNEDGVIVDVNRAFNGYFSSFELVLGQTPAKDWLDYLDDHAVTTLPEGLLEELITSNKDHSGGEIRFRSDSGVLRTFSLDRRKIKSSGHLSGAVITLVDIGAFRAMVDEVEAQRDELVREKNQAVASAEAKNAFFANMGYEIRTPMNTVIGMDDLLMRTKLDDEQRNYAENIRSAAISLLTVVNDLEDYSMIESGKFTLSPQPYSFEALLSGVVAITSARIGEAPLSFLVEVEPGFPAQLIGDENRVRQILLNLLSNAVKFTKRGHIRLAVSCRRHSIDSFDVTFSVEDTGIGMAPERIPHLFSALERAEAQRRREGEGTSTGLGLSVTSSLVDLMNGSIEVDSTQNKGSTFTATIVQGVSADAEDPFDLPNVQDLRLLVCDTDKTSLDSLVKNLLAREVSAQPCETLAGAEEALEEGGFTHIFASMDFSPLFGRFAASKAVAVALLAPFEAPQENGDSVQENQLVYLHKPVLPRALFSILGGHLPAPEEESQDQDAFIAPDALVLVVDDNEINLQVALGLLSVYKLQLDSVTDGFSALEKIRKGNYDLVFMDYMMPGIDGADTTKLIRSDPDSSYMQNLPVVALTANTQPGVDEIFLRAGMNDRMDKPIIKADLERILKTWLPPEKILPAPPPLAQGAIPEEDGGNAPPQAEGRPASPLQMLDPGVVDRIFGGQISAYQRVTKRFAEKGEENIRFIRRLLEEGDLERFTIEVHGVKGAAANLGAMPLSEVAAALEVLGKQGNASEIESALPEFEKTYWDTLAAIGEQAD